MISNSRILPYFPFLALASGALALDPSELMANAWPREEGKSFLSFSVQSTLDGIDYGDYASLYYEYGLTDRITLGVDSGTNLLSGSSTTLFFLQTPLTLSEGPDLFALEFALGGADTSGQWRSAFRTGLSWGRPYDIGSLSGWMGADATYAIYDDGDSLAKLDATLGINHDNGSLTITQLQFFVPKNGRTTVTLAPSHVVKIAGESFVELAGAYQIQDGIASLKLGFWTNF